MAKGGKIDRLSCTSGNRANINVCIGSIALYPNEKTGHVKLRNVVVEHDWKGS